MLKAAVPSNAPFVGRRVELDQLHRTLGSVITAKKPNFVLIQGDIGVGKTALVERFLAEALLGRGDRQQAAELLQAALATYQALELPHDVAETQRLLQQAV